ncbi:hypothetical protein HPP92_025050 [Vanilla planifolia]|uniref:Uncharacterized protein n=1 Tax=Vanilla planifolia TaxID=51239 RepID=A0A835UBY3_VANPL|nr:hypothetical protein HPP92_025050 [Vanilla planifolia]
MASISDDKKVKVAGVGHALLVPYPTQGHINPMLQFANRIASHNHSTTTAITRFIASNMPTLLPTASSPVSIATISDGFDEGGFSAAPSIGAYLASLESAGASSLSDLLLSLADRGDPVSVVIYDSFLPWVVRVARQHGVAAASFFTQSAAVNAVYCHAWQGRMTYPLPAEETTVEGLPGLPKLERTTCRRLLRCRRRWDIWHIRRWC